MLSWLFKGLKKKESWKDNSNIYVMRRGNECWKVCLVIDKKCVLVSTKDNLIEKSSRLNLGKQFLPTTSRYRPENILENAIYLYKL